MRAALSSSILVMILGLGVALPAHAWLAAVPPGRAEAVDVDAAGDVFAAGTFNPVSGSRDRNLGVVKIDGSTGVELWRAAEDGVDPLDTASALALDAAGDAVVAGQIWDIDRREFTVVKVSGVTGAELWRQEIDGPTQQSNFGPDNDKAHDVVVDSAQHVIAAGVLDVGPPITGAGYDYNFFVVKFDGATGGELWRHQIQGVNGRGFVDDRALSVLVDGSDDVLAGGILDRRLFVIKLDGISGAEIWRLQLAELGEALSLALDPAGNVVVAGRLGGETLPVNRLGVLKLDGATGDELWRYTTEPSVEARDVRVDSAGDVFAAGRTVQDGSWAFGVVKLDGSTGEEMWQRLIFGTTTRSFGDPYSQGTATSLELDVQGHPVVAGWLHNITTADDFTVIKFDGSTGSDLWRYRLNGASPTSRFREDHATSVHLHPSGDVITAGGLNFNEDQELVVARLDASTGSANAALSARRVLVLDRSTPARKRLKIVSKSPRTATPEPGAVDDPTRAGATLRFGNPGSEEQVVDLPAEGWLGRGRPAGVWGYRYRNNDPDAVCQWVVVRPGRGLKIRCKGAGIQLTLDESSQDDLAAALTLGNNSRFCVHFGGTIRRNEPGTFIAQDAAAGPSCPFP